MTLWRPPRQRLSQLARYCRLALIVVLGSILLGYALEHVPLAQAIERMLLNGRLQVQANSKAPSDDIVFVANNAWSQQLGQRYQFLGLNRSTLPRGLLAHLVSFLDQQDVRLQVLDVVFKYPNTPWEDRLLVQTLRDAPSVVVAGILEQPLTNTVIAQHAQEFSSYVWVVQHHLAWRLIASPRWLWAANWLPRWQINTVLGMRLLADPEVESRSPQAAQVESADNLPLISSKHWVQSECETTAYNNLYPENFLDELRNKAYPTTYEAPAPVTSSYCRLGPLYGPFLASAHHMGMTQVNYDPIDGKLRSVPLITRGFEGRTYPYLGLKAAAELLDAPRLHYNEKGLYLAGKSFPFITETDGLLPWRNPELGAAREKARAQVRVLHGPVSRQLARLEARVGHPFKTPNDLYWTLYQSSVHPAYFPALAFFTAKPHWQPLDWLAENWAWVEANLALRRLKASPLANPYPVHLARQQLERWHRTTAQQDLNPLDEAETRFWLGGDGHLYRTLPLLSMLAWMQHADVPELQKFTYTIPGVPESGRIDLSNRVVVYGDAIQDVHDTPIGSATYGPEVLANALDGFWHDESWVGPSSWSHNVITWALVGSLAFFIPVLTSQFGLGLAEGLILLFGLITYNTWLFLELLIWAPLFSPLAVGGVGLVGGLSYRYLIQDQEKRQVAQLFGNYVSPQLLETILSNPGEAMEKLKGQRQELSVLFADLKGFTTLVEQQPAEAIAEQLNDFFETVTQVLLRHQGTTDKFIGDAVMAFFGAPVALPNHALSACNAALEIQEAMTAFNHKWTALGRPRFDLSIGISTGPMMVGNLGSKQLKNYTVLGTSVNRGARLETLTRQVPYSILISEATAEQVKEWLAVVYVGEYELKGYDKPQPVYSLEQATGLDE